MSRGEVRNSKYLEDGMVLEAHLQELEFMVQHELDSKSQNRLFVLPN